MLQLPAFSYSRSSKKQVPGIATGRGCKIGMEASGLLHTDNKHPQDSETKITDSCKWKGNPSLFNERRF